MAISPSLSLYYNIRRKYNNDWIDCLNHIYSPLGLIFFALIFLLETIFDRPIYCLINSYEHVFDEKVYPHDRWHRYINSYCYLENKYFVNPSQIGFPLDSTRKAISADFYPWVMVMFVLQSILFVLPHWIWEAFNFKSGITLRSLAIGLTSNDKKAKKVYGKRAFGLDFSDGEPVPAFIGTLTYNLKRKDKIFLLFSPQTYFSNSYLFYKFGNLVNVVLQFVFVNFALTHYTLRGFEFVWNLIRNGINWKSSGHFPLIVFCDFNRRDDATGKSFTATSQCLLPFNYLYESMFIVTWFWLIFVFICNFCSFISTFWFLFSYNRRANFVEKLLAPHGIHKENPNFGYFVRKILGKDGVSTLRILHANLSHFQVSEFTKELFEACNDLFPPSPGASNAATTTQTNINEAL
uniref:Innexin n=1 Tax=Panagrolaimus sp. ES5 TaxID=591445 RepID=A0AC34FXM3_9BILA